MPEPAPRRGLRHTTCWATSAGSRSRGPGAARARPHVTGPCVGGGLCRQRDAATDHDLRRQPNAVPTLPCPEGRECTAAVSLLSRQADPSSQAVLARTTMGTMGGVGAHRVCLLLLKKRSRPRTVTGSLGKVLEPVTCWYAALAARPRISRSTPGRASDPVVGDRLGERIRAAPARQVLPADPRHDAETSSKARHMAAYRPSRASSSPWLPSSRTRP